MAIGQLRLSVGQQLYAEHRSATQPAGEPVHQAGQFTATFGGRTIPKEFLLPRAKDAVIAASTSIVLTGPGSKSRSSRV